MHKFSPDTFKHLSFVWVKWRHKYKKNVKELEKIVYGEEKDYIDFFGILSKNLTEI